MAIVKRVLAVGAALAAVFGIVTVLALESHEVVILRTHGRDGTSKETRVWVADEDGFAWLEAPTEDRLWYRHVLENPSVELERAGRIEHYGAEPVPGAEGHTRIRHLLQAKYGLADTWVGLLQDTSKSIAVRLRPLGGGDR